MPKGKKGFRVRGKAGFQYRKRNYKNGKAQEALVKANLALSLLNPEFKFIDTFLNATLTHATPNIVLLNGCQRGDDINQRIGRSIRNKSLELRFRVAKNSASTASSEVVVCMLVLATDPKGVAPTISDILADTTLAGMTISPRNLNNRKHIIILKRWCMPLGLVGTGGQINICKEKYKELNYHTIYDSDNLGTIADIASNALYFVSFSNTSANNPTIVMSNRIRFLDN